MCATTMQTESTVTFSANNPLMDETDLQTVADRAKRMLAVTSALSTAATVADVTGVTLGIGLRVVEAARGIIGCLDPSSRKLHFHTAGYDAEMHDRIAGTRLLVDDAPVTRCVRTGIPVYLRTADEYRTHFPWAYRQVGAVCDTQAYAAIPLVHKGKTIGGLGLSFAQPTAFGAADCAFTLLLADATAGALARAMTFDAELEGRRARDDMLAMVAHDLRNPLSLIAGTSQLLVELDLPTHKRQELLGASQRAVSQMNRLIGDLLDVSSIRTGTFALRLDDCPVDAIMRQVDETMRPLAQQSGISFRIDGAPPATQLRGDSSRIVQAVGNLVANALKFTPRGGDVSVRATRGRRTVAFAVIDNGPGISEDGRRRLFDAFWQEQHDRRGIGLGLTIVKGIVDAHHGRVVVRSTVGRGSTFALVCPRVRTVEDAS
ncbi:MAG: GAF domain-containing sensor histidine kinase [bacterium]